MADADVVNAIAAGTSAIAAVAAFATSTVAVRMQRQGNSLEARQVAAADIGRWARNALETVERLHDPASWRVPEGVEYGSETGISAGDVVPPSQGRFGPMIEVELAKFDGIRSIATLAFGEQHEVTVRVADLMDAIREVADRGVIYGEPGMQTPREYIDEVFRPRALELYDSLEGATSLESSKPGP